jgi:hypothetical protein
MVRICTGEAAVASPSCLRAERHAVHQTDHHAAAYVLTSRTSFRFLSRCGVCRTSFRSVRSGNRRTSFRFHRRVRESAKSAWWTISPLIVTIVTRLARTWMIAVTYWWVCCSAMVMVLPKRLTVRLERT